MNIKPEIQVRVLKHRNHLHQFPELSFKEYKTQEYIISELNRIGIPNQKMAGTGVVGLIGKSEKCIALRADIDALPIVEETGYEFSSKNEGVMHACGHDFHTSMLLGAAEVLKENEDKLNCQIKLIFQPGEECQPGGASIMIKEGVLENPKVEEIYGIHVFPEAETGTISMVEGPVMASTNEFYITIKGKGCHAAQPHIGKDPILAAAQLINHYQTLITKYRDPIDPAVITVASIDGRSAVNAIPDTVKMEGVIRTFNDDLKKEIVDLIEKNSTRICETYGCEFELRTIWGYPTLVNDKNAVRKAEEIAEKTVGKEKVLVFKPKMWAEDFSKYAQEVPGAFVFLGVKPKEIDEMPPLHNSKLLPDIEALKVGTEFFVNLALSQ